MKGERISEWAKELGRRVPQGTDFNYLATDTHVLSTALKGVYGKPVADVLSEKLWELGGFTADATWSQDAKGEEGVALGHCCLSVTLTDFAHLGQLYLEDLVFDGKQTVPDDWFDLVANPHASFQEPHAEAGRDDVSFGYSYQFWLPPGYDNEFVARGALGQYLWIDRKRGFVVAQFATAAYHNSLEYSKMMRAIGDALQSSEQE
jgi:CubicO group peptidase (beta-lactamase class C family)